MTKELIGALKDKYGVDEAIRLYLVLKNCAIKKRLIKPGDVFVTLKAVNKLKKDKEASHVIDLATRIQK